MLLLKRIRQLLIVGSVLLVSNLGWSTTLSAIRTAVRINIRDTATSTSLQRYSDSTLNTFINEGQRDIVNNTWILSSYTSFSLSDSVGSYTLPTDVISIQRVSRSNGNLPEVTMAQLDFDTGNSTWPVITGLAQYYYQDKSTPDSISIYPIPNASNLGTLKIIYYCTATTLSSDSDVPLNSTSRFLNYHDLLIWYASFRILYIEANPKATVFKDLYDTRLRVLYEDYGAKPERVPEVKTKENK